jgi:hypothetical protein
MANEGLLRAREAREAARVAGIKQDRLNPMQKAQAHPNSLRMAINGKCYDCVGQDADPNPRGRVRDCNCKGCCLWHVRPWQRSDEDSDE